MTDARRETWWLIIKYPDGKERCRGPSFSELEAETRMLELQAPQMMRWLAGGEDTGLEIAVVKGGDNHA